MYLKILWGKELSETRVGKFLFYKGATKVERKIVILMKRSKTDIHYVIFRKNDSNKIERSGRKRILTERDD